jgi:hypothetical protein
MPIDSVEDPFAEISSEASGLCTMKECVWLRSESVARIDFLEWTGADHFRHQVHFASRRGDSNCRDLYLNSTGIGPGDSWRMPSRGILSGMVR